jgi:hypothetical protein
MIGFALALVGLLLGILGWALLRRGGTGWRVGRLLSAAPQRTLAEAMAMAARGEPAYIRIHGRVDSAEEFPGDDGTPLVFRRRRLQRQVSGLRDGRSWRTFDDERVAVPFGLTQQGDRVAIDVDALGDGLVVVPRVSLGVAADLPPPASAGPPWPALAPDAPVALRIEQVGTVDHGTACGVPQLTTAGETILGPGLRRPLILTTLDLDEAMRILGSEQRTSLVAAAGLLVAGPAVIVAGLLVALLAG